MKKLLSIMLVLTMAFLFVACGGSTDSKDTQTSGGNAIMNKDEENSEAIMIIEVDSLAELEELAEKDVEETIDSLTQKFEELKSKIDTYNMYKANTDSVENFYAEVVEVQQDLTIRLREYALVYAGLIINSDSSTDDMYDEMEDIFDIFYDGTGDEIYDEIYDGILDESYEVFYDGILDDAYDTANYSEWSDLRSDEYDWWSDARSDAYDDWSDFRSDVYDFWSDMRSELWDDDIEKAVEEIEDFKDDIIKLKDK